MLSERLSADEAAGMAAMEGIMTTDTIVKMAAEKLVIDGKTVTLAGMAKGSGMIHPNMGTMLAYVTTDADISPSLLQKALSASVKDSYNMVSVDGDTSTNDTVLVLANGMAGNTPIYAENENYEQFFAVLHRVNVKLAKDIARDGEGAGKLIEVTVSGAGSEEDARLIAKSVVSSNLFKAAVFGADANWGRVLCAMGYSGGQFDPENVTIVFHSGQGTLTVIEKGNPVEFDEDLATKILCEKEISVDIHLDENAGYGAKAWGCDLTYEYVRINGDYRS
jgi:glutamate N-acetyltransferase/amino-acid N-acetyltransferase